jgi:hypothetical protein
MLCNSLAIASYCRRLGGEGFDDLGFICGEGLKAIAALLPGG